MVIIHGLSQCTSTLLVELDRIFPNQIQNLTEIQHFQRQLPQLIVQQKQIAKDELDHQITQLNNRIQSIKQEYETRYAMNIAQIKVRIKNMQQNKDKLSNLQISVGKRIIYSIKRLYITLQISWLTQNLHRYAEKPLRPLLKEKKSLTLTLQNLKTNYFPLIAQKVRPYLLAQQCLDAKKEVIMGAVGEESVIHRLQGLPDTFHLLNNIELALNRSVFWKKGGKYVRTAQIDHILVGPTGLFLIETKNWSLNTFRNAERSPHFQIDRAAFVFYLKSNSNFQNRLKPRSVVVTLRQMPYKKYPFVDQIAISELHRYIYNRKVELSSADVLELVEIIEHL